ncbi:MAG: long-chain-acyl-CoA synthetase [Alphaproteobacteria bacterium]
MGLLETAKREKNYVSSMLALLKTVKDVKPDGSLTVADLIEDWALRKPDNLAIIFEDREITYGELDAAANRVARWAEANGIGRGDVVALVMENKPEYITTWYGIAKLGARLALINNNLAGSALAHTLNISGADHIILDANLIENYSSAADKLEREMKVWAQGGDVQGAEDWDKAIAEQDGSLYPVTARRGMKTKDNFVYIYTSGTTGLPKAANISHFRFMMIGLGFAGATRIKEADRMYMTLPLYHATGGVGGTVAALSQGAAVILRRKFSASAFFDDCIKYDATMFTYIGELCRYLLNAPENPNERNHKIRNCIGNGLRPEVWGPFQERYALPNIVEFYGSTEGNVSLFNVDSKPGAIGRVPNYMLKLLPNRIVKFDVENEDVIRNEDGFCIEADFDEAGEAIGKIDTSNPRTSFEGYSNKEATEKKILRDVFEKGDMWFRTGDLLKKDKHGYFYFVDRIGDTFRWKGENVATSEVGEVLSHIDGIEEANVYGVEVPGADGRAGMASVVVAGDLDRANLRKILERDLPAYARPIFLRLQGEMEVTGTFKHRKVDLVKEGFDPDQIADPIIWLNPATGDYDDLTAESYAAIIDGSIRI